MMGRVKYVCFCVCSVQCLAFSIVLYFVQYAVCSVQCTVYTVQWYSALWAGGANDRNKMPQIGVILAPI